MLHPSVSFGWVDVFPKGFLLFLLELILDLLIDRLIVLFVYCRIIFPRSSLHLNNDAACERFVLSAHH